LNEGNILWRTKLLAIIVDIRRVGDLASNIAEFAIGRVNRNIAFSDTGVSDLNRMFDLAEVAYTTAIQSLKTRDLELAKQTERLEEQIDTMERELRAGHISRLEAGVCNPQADTIFVETVRNLERIGDHADSIALDVIAEY
jgi:phosphate:Na+ symporter